jgi:hypothetical protein
MMLMARSLCWSAVPSRNGRPGLSVPCGEYHVPAIREDVAQALAPLGLRLLPAKTRVVHMSDGFDFLGFYIPVAPQAVATRRPVRTVSRGGRSPLKAGLLLLASWRADCAARAGPAARRWR